MVRIASAWGIGMVWVPLLVACSAPEREPVSAQNLALTAETNVERALRGAHEAGSFIADSALLAKLFSSASGSSCEPTPAPPPCADGAVCPPPEDPTCDADSVSVADLKESRQELSDSIDELLKTLREEVFTPENLESETGSAAVYLLGPEFLCKNGDSTGTSVPTPGGVTPTPEPEPPLDSACVERAQRLQPRLSLTSPSEGNVDVALLLTAQKKNPVTLQLRADGVGALFDLGELKATLDTIDEPIDGLAALSGQIQVELEKNGALDYSFRVNALTALALTTLDDLQQKVAISFAKSVPAFELRLDGNARKLTGSYDFGALGVSGPLNAFRDLFDDTAPTAAGEPAPEKAYTGTIDALLAGLDGSVVFDGQRDQVSLRGLGLGDASSALKFNGETLAQLDLNPSAGRHFDLTLEKTADEQTTLTFSPTFDLDLLLNFAPLANQIADIPQYLSSDRLKMWFDGANPSVRAEKAQLRVLSGTLNLSSASVPAANLQVAPGSCLLDSGAAAPEHELLGQFSAGACQ